MLKLKYVIKTRDENAFYNPDCDTYIGMENIKGYSNSLVETETEYEKSTQSVYKCGDILDLHNYPAPELYLYDPDRITVLGEYGGIGLVLKDHLWEPERNWGYVKFNSEKDVTDEYEKYIRILQDLIPKGFSAAVYTQTTDVEIEVNGLMTYDRKVIKIDQERIRKLNEEVCSSLSK